MLVQPDDELVEVVRRLGGNGTWASGTIGNAEREDARAGEGHEDEEHGRYNSANHGVRPRDHGTLSGSGRMLGESDPQERGRCGIGFIGGRMRAALRGNLGHRLSVGAGSRRILFTNLGTPVEFRSRTSK